MEIKKEYPATIQEIHIIRAHECDLNSKLKLHVLLDYFQDIAATHAELLDVGFDAFSKHGAIWVLSRMKVEITRYPLCNEKIILSTYPSGINGPFAAREYVMQDENGNILAKGTSFWLVINTKNYRPAKAADFLPENMPMNPDKERFFRDLGKIAAKELASEFLCTIRHGDIDMNRHLNNALFARNILDCLCHKKGEYLYVKEIQLNFIRSGELGDTLSFGGELAEDGSFYAQGASPDGKNLYIQAAGTLME